MTEYRGDCDCFNYSVQVKDKEFAHQLSENHRKSRDYPKGHIDWSVIEG